MLMKPQNHININNEIYTPGSKGKNKISNHASKPQKKNRTP